MIKASDDVKSSTYKLEVLHSNAGYYIGTYDYTDENYGPVERHSNYFKTWDEAQQALKNNNWEPRF